MLEYLSRLAARTLGRTPVVQPLLTPMFAPLPQVASTLSSLVEEIETTANQPQQYITSHQEPELSRQELSQLRDMPFASSPTSLPHPLAISADQGTLMDQATAEIIPSDTKPETSSEIAREVQELPRVQQPDTPPRAGRAMPEDGVQVVLHYAARPSVQPFPLEEGRPHATYIHVQANARIQRQQLPVESPSVTLSSRPHTERNNAPETAPPPTIQVTINRVEVRALQPPTPAPTQKTASTKPRLSLDDYLKAPSGGKP